MPENLHAPNPQLENRQERVERACQDFLMMVDTPDASALERIIERYPDCATELTDFAVEWTIQDLQPTSSMAADDELDWDADWSNASWAAAAAGQPPAGQTIASSAVESAMDLLRQRLGSPAADPFVDLSPDDLRGVAARLHLDTPLLAKLRHRRLLPSTVPGRLIHALAVELKASLATVRAHLEAAPILPAGASFKADARPDPEPRESFATALERSSLAAESRQRWLGSDA